jgi:pimeloyl-ACP methyl ester carboxylesterase
VRVRVSGSSHRMPRVLLVEGICGDAADWDAFDEVLSDSGFVVSRLQYASPFFSLRPQDYTRILTAALEGMGPGRVAVVAHSMGGLIAREYMRKQAATPASKGKIAQLVTLGTPHHGSDLLSQVLSLWAPLRWVVGKILNNPCLSSPLTRPALRDMAPGSWFLNRLNYGGQRVDSAGSHGWDTHLPETSLPANVYLASIAGTGTFCKPLYRDMFWKPKGVYRPNDCTVATGGSLLANTNTFRAADPALSLEKPAAHTPEETTPCGEAYYRFGTLAQRVARILLTSPAALPISTPVDEPGELPTAGVGDEEEDFQAAPAIDDSVPAGQTVTETFAIPATSRVRFALVSTDAHLSLLDPNGTTITVNDTSQVAGIAFFNTDGGALECFEIANPQSGIWTMRIDAASSIAGQRAGVIAQYLSGSVAGLSVSSDLLYAGDVVRVRGQLITGPTRRTDVTWSCRIVRPDEASDLLTLYDDGAHGDSLAADGIYGNSATPTGGVGLYVVVGSASAPGVGPLAAVAYCEVADTQDLAVQPSDIVLSEDPPSAGDSVTVYATVHNNSSKPAMGVTVEIRDLRADTVLGAGTVDLAMGGTATVQAPWIPASPDSHEISVHVSPYVLDESDYSNNTASRVVVVQSPVGVDPGHTSSTLRFDPPRPNPTSLGVVFSFSLPQRSTASLHVHDILGRRIRSWSWTSLSPGRHFVEWDGRGPNGERSATGVYLCSLVAGTERLQRRIVLRR